MRLGATILWALLVSIAGAGLFLLKSQVQEREDKLARLQVEITQTQDSIHVLDAEWSYLNDTTRLRDESSRLLGLQPIKPSQLATLDSLPMADPANPQPAPSSSPTPAPLPPLASAPHANDAAIALRTPR